MRKTTQFLCMVIVTAIFISAGRIIRELPVDRQAIVAEKYQDWAGVLEIRVWDGAPMGWLNECAARFEKRHNGVYIQFNPVADVLLCDYSSSGMRQPDALIFPTGMSVSEDGLGEVSAAYTLRKGLAGCGEAIPIALDIFCWAYNAANLQGIPVNWSEYTAAIPADTLRRCYSAAAIALCTGMYSADVQEEAPSLYPDLGLTLPDAEPSPTPVPAAVTPCDPAGRILPSDDAMRDFLQGDADAIVASRQELIRLEQLSDAGRAPDWRVSRTGSSIYCEGILFSVTARGEDDARQQALCEEFLNELLSDRSQSALAARGYFSVRSDLRIHDSGIRAQIEASADGRAVTMASEFDNTWREQACTIIREFQAPNANVNDLWAQLQSYIRTL